MFLIFYFFKLMYLRSVSEYVCANEWMWASVKHFGHCDGLIKALYKCTTIPILQYIFFFWLSYYHQNFDTNLCLWMTMSQERQHCLHAQRHPQCRQSFFFFFTAGSWACVHSGSRRRVGRGRPARGPHPWAHSGGRAGQNPGSRAPRCWCRRWVGRLQNDASSRHNIYIHKNKHALL